MRKQLGLTFIGETQEEQRIFIADVFMNGISSEVSSLIIFITHILMLHSEVLASMGSWYGQNVRFYAGVYTKIDLS